MINIIVLIRCKLSAKNIEFVDLRGKQ